MNWDNTYYNSSSKAYYYNSTSYSNHAVTIVGWDDTYSRTNFNQAAPGDGAFIIKNSWDTSFGDNGYFYLSYYDSKVGKDLTAFTGESAANYNHIYQYDPLGWIQSFGYGSDTAWAANVFTASSKESLEAVGFYTNQVDTAYQIFIYTNPDQGPISSAGPVSTVQGTIGIPGFHSITLPTPVSLNAGQKFSVVVRFQTPNYLYPIAIESPVSGYSGQATAGAGQSYTSSTGWIWIDLTAFYPNTNACLKAYTVNTPPLVAALSATPTTGTAPLTVVFTDTTVGGIPTMWNWSFGDGSWFNTTLSSERNATHIYTTAGTHTAYLTVSDSGDSSTSSGKTITVTPPPQLIADFTANTSEGTAPLTVAFTDTTVGGIPTMWNWSFGDGNWFNTTLSSERNPTYIYTSAGTYTVYLTVSNAVSTSTSGGRTITITPPPQLIADFTANTSEGTAPLAVLFTDTTVGGTPTMWNWSFGDGNWFNTTLVSERNPTYIYTSIGTYTVYLTVSNAVSTSISGDRTITVTPPPQLIADFTTNTSAGTAPLAVLFTDTTVGGTPTVWKWSFGDGNWFNTTLSSERNPTYIYTSTGTYTVYLTVSNAVSTSTSGGRTIAIILPPYLIADFTANTSEGTAPLAVLFTDTTVGGTPTMWNWSFGDGNWFNTTLVSERNPTHVYTIAGTHTTYLTVSDSGDSSTSSGKTITVTPTPELTAAFTTNTSAGAAPLTVLFTDISTGDTPTEWNWSFRNVTGDNTQVWWSTDQNPVKTFEAGNYSIVLNASNSAGYNISTQVTFINVTAATVTQNVTPKTGVYRPGVGFYLKMDNGSSWSPLTDKYLAWDNAAGDLPIAGDWNMDRRAETGVYRPGVGFYLKMDNGSSWSPSTDVYLAWDNAAGDLPIAGDWNMDGRAETGVYRPGVGFYLKMDNGSSWSPSTDVYLAWDNAAGDRPIAGDWNMDGRAETGVYRPGVGFYLKMDNASTWNSSTDKYLSWDNAAGDLPIAGDWNADGQAETGVYRPGVGFYLKMDNGSTWNSSTDKYLAWDNANVDLPVAGKFV
jgi:PKD repeat protein